MIKINTIFIGLGCSSTTLEKKISKKFLSQTFLSIGKWQCQFFQSKIFFSKKFFFSDTTQNAKFRGLGCFSTTLVPDPPQSIGKKIFFLFFLADSENIYLSYVLRKKNFFSVLSTTFLKYRKKSMSNFKKFFFSSVIKINTIFIGLGCSSTTLGKKIFFEKISKSNFFKYRKMAMSNFSVKNIFFKKFFFLRYHSKCEI